MPPKIIELKQAPVVLVELPEGSTRHRMQSIIGVYRMDYLVYDLPNNNNTFIGLPIGVNHEIVGILSDLTEEQFAECVDKYPDNSNPAMYVNYTYKKPNGGMQVSRVTFPWRNKASDSFYSLLESENVYTENPYGSSQMQHLASASEPGDISELSQEWEQAQSRTIDPSRTVVLLRKED